MMPLGLLLDLGFEEILRRPEPIRRERAPHSRKQRFGSRQQPRFEQRRGDADVGETLALAIIDGSNAVAHLEADVPEEREEALNVRLPIGRIALRQEHHDVDVGTRVQLAAAIAADGDQPQVAGKLAGVSEPRRAQRHIHQSRAIAHQIFDRLVGDETIFEQFAALIEYLAKAIGENWPSSRAAGTAVK